MTPPRSIRTALTPEQVALARQCLINPLPDLTPERLVQQITNFKAGTLRDLALTMDSIEERDDVVQTVAPKAKAAVARRQWDVLTVETDDEAEAQAAQAQREVLLEFYDGLRVSHALDGDQLGSVRLLVEQMMDAKGKRYAAHHIQWLPRPGGRYTATLTFVPLWFFEARTGRLRFIRDMFGYDGEEMKPGEWLVSVGRGLMIACSIAWMYKRLPLRDWLIYCSRYGLPGIEGVTDAQEGTAEYQRVVDAVAAAASEFAWVRGTGDEINTIDFKGQGEIPHPALVERMDRALSALWRGADLSTLSAGSGAGDGASLQGDESNLLEEDDACWISETLNLRLDRLVLDYVFGPGTPALAYFKLINPEKDNIELDLRIDEFAVRHGHPISRQQFAERYNRPLPEDDADLLAAPAPVPTALPGMPGFGQEAAINERHTPGAPPLQAIARLTQAQRRQFAPILARVEALSRIQDPDALDRAVRRLRADWDALGVDVLAQPHLAEAWEEALGAAAFEGAVAAQQKLIRNRP